MTYCLQDFRRDAREALKTGSSRAHVEKIRAPVERLRVER